MSTAIETIDIVKSFHKPTYKSLFLWKNEAIPVLKNISIKADKGEVYGILGPNGTGKTTLIKILSSLITPDSGNVLIDGVDVQKHRQRVRRRIGYITSEERSFYWRLTGKQNLFFFATLYNLSNKKASKRISYLARLLDFEAYLEKPFMSYSTGVKQRFAIARGLLCDPEILLMDEPTRSLDSLSKIRFQEFIKQKIIGEQNKTIILATHDLLEAEHLCDRLAIILQGRVAVTGRFSDIKKKFSHRKKFFLQLRVNNQESISNSLCFNGVSDIKILSSLNGKVEIELQLENENIISSIIERLVCRKVHIQACIPREMSLKDIFKEVVA